DECIGGVENCEGKAARGWSCGRGLEIEGAGGSCVAVELFDQSVIRVDYGEAQGFSRRGSWSNGDASAPIVSNCHYACTRENGILRDDWAAQACIEFVLLAT